MLHPLLDDAIPLFSVHPTTVVGIAGLGALYAWRAHRERRAPTSGQWTAFIGGLVAMFLALNGPLHDLSDGYLFSAHMLQHMLLVLAVPPLLILGVPGELAASIVQVRGLGAIERALRNPVFAWTLGMTALWI